MCCPMCDGFGVVDRPGGGRQKCPECDTEPPWYLRMNMAAMLFGPDGPTEDDDMTPVQNRYAAAARIDDFAFAYVDPGDREITREEIRLGRLAACDRLLSGADVYGTRVGEPGVTREWVEKRRAKLAGAA